MGGTRTYTLSLAAELRKRGCDAIVVGSGLSSEEGGYTFESVSPRALGSNYDFHRCLRAWVRSHRFDSSAVIDAQRPDFLVPFLKWASRTVPVCTLHGDPLAGMRLHRPIASLAYRFAERSALRAAKRVISVSETGRRSYVGRHPFLSGKITVIPVGIDTGVFRPSAASRARAQMDIADGPVLLYAGRLEPEKRVEVVLQAVANLSRPPLVLIAGTGTQEKRLRKMAARLPVRFLGPIPHDQMASVITACDALVLPSAIEGLPTVAIEALACGIPVIATPVGDLPLLVKPGRTGILFDGSAVSLSRILEQDLANLGELTRECANTGRLFGWDRIAANVLEVLRSAAN